MILDELILNDIGINKCALIFKTINVHLVRLPSPEKSPGFLTEETKAHRSGAETRVVAGRATKANQRRTQQGCYCLPQQWTSHQNLPRKWPGSFWCPMQIYAMFFFCGLLHKFQVSLFFLFMADTSHLQRLE